VTTLGQTPSQTIGPYFAMKLEPVALLVGPETEGERIRIVGRILDGDRQHVEDAVVEIWQANACGRYRHPADHRAADADDESPANGSFTGYGRVHGSFETGEYSFETIKPGKVPDSNGGLQAPHLNLIVTARGLLNHCHTRLYFGDEAVANRTDLVLGQVPDTRRKTLIGEPLDAKPGEAEPIATYRFDIRFQGDDETVFFAL